jgi:hypothetical protein
VSTRLYQLLFKIGDGWLLGEPMDAGGNRVDPGYFGEGKRLELDELSFPVSHPGHPLDVTFKRSVIVVTELVGSLIAELAPGDVQRIPARIESRQERYEVINVLTRIDCIDWERTAAHVMVMGDPPHVEKGSLAALTPLLEPRPGLSLYRHVSPGDMRLRTERIEGPRIFRVVDWDMFPVVTEEIKTALEAEGATGLAYWPAS